MFIKSFNGVESINSACLPSPGPWKALKLKDWGEMLLGISKNLPVESYSLDWVLYQASKPSAVNCLICSPAWLVAGSVNASKSSKIPSISFLTLLFEMFKFFLLWSNALEIDPAIFLPVTTSWVLLPNPDLIISSISWLKSAVKLLVDLSKFFASVIKRSLTPNFLFWYWDTVSVIPCASPDKGLSIAAKATAPLYLFPVKESTIPVSDMAAAILKSLAPNSPLLKAFWPKVYLSNFPPKPNKASPPAPIAASVANNSASSPGVFSCKPATYSKDSSIALPPAAPTPVPAETTPNWPTLIFFNPANFGLSLPLVNIEPAIEPTTGPIIPEKSEKSFQEKPDSSITTYLFDVGFIFNFFKPSGVKAKSPLLFLVNPCPPTACSKILSFSPWVSAAPSFTLSQGAFTPDS